MAKDTIYNKQNISGAFKFDAQTVDVFADMIDRSVPGYGLILKMIGLFAQNYEQPKTNIYDLGCSIGSASKILRQCTATNNKIIAVDNSYEMIKMAKKNLATFENMHIICDDIKNIKIINASVVLLNLTLQFIFKEKRQELIDNIYLGMQENAALIIVEKVNFVNKNKEDIMQKIYYSFKKSNGYSQLEIAQKRQALENVLIPDSKFMHKKRLKKAGFTKIYNWYNCLNFTGFIAFK